MHLQFTIRSLWRPRNLNFRTVSTTNVAKIDHSINLPTTTEDNNELPPDRRLDSDLQVSRGYLRSQRPYTPPSNVQSDISRICEKYRELEEGSFRDHPLVKFKVLKECSTSFKHSIPSSHLHRVNTVGDLISFYQTPVNTTVPLDRMKDMDLPPNLHVLYDYVRFHPETDTKFGGISAFPESSTIMSDLKAKKKYPGYIAKKKSLG